MKKSIIALALLAAAIATPALAQSRAQAGGIYSGAPAGSDAYAYHEQLAQGQGD
jgi:hypothetical protein